MADKQKGNFDLSFRPRSPKRPFPTHDPEPDILYEQFHETTKRIKTLKKQAKPKSTFSIEFWEASADLAKANFEEQGLQMSIKLRELKKENEDIEKWQNSDEASQFTKSQRLYQAKEKSCRKQMEKLKNFREDSDGKKRRVFLGLFTTSSKGLKIKQIGEGRRGSSLQSNFRKDLIETYKLENPDQKTSIWDVVLGDYVQKDDTTTAHLFGYSHGLELMEAMFGEGAEKDMFDPCNGLMLYTPIERKMDEGFFVIVPDVADSPTISEIQRWNSAEPKGFKIRFMVDSTHPDLDNIIRSPNPTTWRNLEGRRLRFPRDCNFRPKSRYLYFMYCSAVLRRSFNKAPRGQALKKELGKVYWGTPGRYMSGAMLQALVEEMGGEGWEELMKGSMEDPRTITQSDPTLVQLQVVEAKKEIEEQRGEDSDSDDDDG